MNIEARTDKYRICDGKGRVWELEFVSLTDNMFITFSDFDDSYIVTKDGVDIFSGNLDLCTRSHDTCFIKNEPCCRWTLTDERAAVATLELPFEPDPDDCPRDRPVRIYRPDGSLLVETDDCVMFTWIQCQIAKHQLEGYKVMVDDNVREFQICPDGHVDHCDLPLPGAVYDHLLEEYLGF